MNIKMRSEVGRGTIRIFGIGAAVVSLGAIAHFVVPVHSEPRPTNGHTTTTPQLLSNQGKILNGSIDYNKICGTYGKPLVTNSQTGTINHLEIKGNDQATSDQDGSTKSCKELHHDQTDQQAIKRR